MGHWEWGGGPARSGDAAGRPEPCLSPPFSEEVGYPESNWIRRPKVPPSGGHHPGRCPGSAALRCRNFVHKV
ncbi:hypothetical protein GCM10022293_41530 [Azospirillum formosense]